MRVLLVSDNYPPLAGGANRATQMLAHSLIANGDEVEVVSAWHPRHATTAFDEMGVRVTRVRDSTSYVRRHDERFQYTPPPAPDPMIVAAIRRVIRRFSPDVVHTYGWLSYSVALACVGAPRIGLALSLRDYGHVCALRTLVHGEAACSTPAPSKCMACSIRHYGVATGGAGLLGIASFGRLLARRLDGIHAISRFVLQVAEDHYLTSREWDLPRWVIPSFTDLGRSGGEPGDPLIGLPSDPYILYVGSLRLVKGVDVLLEAYSRLPNPAPPLVLLGAHTRDTPAVPPGVISLGEVGRPAMRTAWSRALFGVAPSRWPEPLGNVVHEGMRAGKAVIGTHPGGHREMIQDGQTGLIVRGGRPDELACAMVRLLENPGECSKMGDAAKLAASRYTAEALWPQFQSFYAAVLEHAGRRSRGLRG